MKNLRIINLKGELKMKNLKLIVLYCCLLVASVFAGGPAWAGGVSLYEFGSPDVGLAAAGYAARAQDASTLFTNPAGMSRLEKSQVMIGVQGVYGFLDFEPNSTSTYLSNDGGNAVGFMPGGSNFFVHKINQDFSAGFGILSYFGSGAKYTENWVGRYYVQESMMIGMTFMPAVSYRVTKWLSLGAGVNIMYGILKNEVAVNNAGDSRPDGRITLDDKKWGYGANLGILLEPMPGTRFGLTYLSEVKLDFSAVPEFSGMGQLLGNMLVHRGLATNTLDMSVTVPQMIMFSAYHDLNEKWAIMGNFGWQNWSRFGQVDVGINTSNPVTLTVDSDYNDTWHVAFGTKYRLSPALSLTGGIAYDSSAVTNEKRTVTVPMGEAWRFALGAEYAFTPTLSMGAAYEFIWTGNMPVDQERGPLAGRVSGEYENMNINVFALNLTWRY